MPGRNISLWRWIPAGDACGDCEALRGDHPEEPSRPHPNCKCVCVKMEKQVNPRNRSPYQVGFQLANPGINSEKSNTWTVVVTCMRPSDDDDDEDGDGWAPGESHYGSIDLPAEPGGLSGEQQAAWEDQRESALHDYARQLFEGYCVGWV